MKFRIGGVFLNKDTFDRDKWLPIIIVGVILMLFFYIFGNIGTIMHELSRFTGILSPLLIGTLLTYFLYSPHFGLEKLLRKVKIKKFVFISKHARGISTVVIFLTLIGIIALVLAFLLPTIFSSVVDLARNVPQYARDVVYYWNNLPEDHPLYHLNLASIINEYSGDIVSMIVNSPGIEQATQGVVSFAGSLLNVVLGIFLSLYILLYRDELGEYCLRLNGAIFKNRPVKNRIVKYMRSINSVLHTFIASKGLDALLNFTAASLVTTIFGVPYSLLMGLIAGLFNFIPYLGSIMSSLLISIIAIVTKDLSTGIYVAICLFIFQQMDANFIEPRIMKSSLKINPILVIMAVVIGGAYMGIPGMFLGVPIAVIIKQIIDEYISASEEPVMLDDSRR